MSHDIAFQRGLGKPGLSPAVERARLIKEGHPQLRSTRSFALAYWGGGLTVGGLAARVGWIPPLAMLAPGSAQAATMAGVEELIRWPLMYLLGLGALILIAAIAKDRLAFQLLLGYIALPFLLAGYLVVVHRQRQAEIEHDLQVARQRRFEEEGRKVRDCIEGVVKDASCRQYLEWKPPEGLDGSSLGVPQGRGR